MTFQDVILVLVGLLSGAGVFLVGVKLLSSNIEKLASSGIKSLFGKTANNKLINVGIGAVTTALVQSSGVTTVLIVGFTNVGIMSLYQATAMIMGANIGTTLTAQIAALNTFKFTDYITVISFIGIMGVMIFKKDTPKKIGYIIAGFGLIFIGLSLMSNSLTPLKEQASDIFTTITNPFLLFLIGIFLTALVQSSAAITSIIISIAVAGLTIGDGGNSVLFIILGTNIGSCVTALMSSIGSSPNARRTSLIHLMFNSFGSIIFFIVLMIFPNFMNSTFAKWFPETATQIAMFHTAFNVICTLVFLPFSSVFVKIATFLVKDAKVEKEYAYLDERIISNTALAIEQVEKESSRLQDISMIALTTAYNSFKNKTLSGLDETREQIDKSNRLSKIITDYIIKVSATSNAKQEKTISNLYNNLGDIMRISEIADNFIKYTTREVENDLNFSPQIITQLDVMFEKIVTLHELTKQIIATKNRSLLTEIDEVEESVDNLRKSLLNMHIERLNNGECKPENSSIFINLVSNLERLGDHLTYIAHTVKRK